MYKTASKVAHFSCKSYINDKNLRFFKFFFRFFLLVRKKALPLHPQKQKHWGMV